MRAHPQALEPLSRDLQAALERLAHAASSRSVPDDPEADPVPLAVSAWRREHRPGREPRLSADPEQRAFVESRLGSMTCTAIADAARARFGPDRAVGKSAVHAWHRKYFLPSLKYG